MNKPKSAADLEEPQKQQLNGAVYSVLYFNEKAIMEFDNMLEEIAYSPLYKHKPKYFITKRLKPAVALYQKNTEIIKKDNKTYVDTVIAEVSDTIDEIVSTDMTQMYYAIKREADKQFLPYASDLAYIGLAYLTARVSTNYLHQVLKSGIPLVNGLRWLDIEQLAHLLGQLLDMVWKGHPLREETMLEYPTYKIVKSNIRLCYENYWRHACNRDMIVKVADTTTAYIENELGLEWDYKE